MSKFWQWVYHEAKRQCKKRVNCDLKCPECHEWSSCVGGFKLNDTSVGYIWVCENCTEMTAWRTDLFPMPVLQENYPITEQKNDQ